MIHDRLGQTVLSYRKKNNMTIRELLITQELVHH